MSADDDNNHNTSEHLRPQRTAAPGGLLEKKECRLLGALNLRRNVFRMISGKDLVYCRQPRDSRCGPKLGCRTRGNSNGLAPTEDATRSQLRMRGDLLRAHLLVLVGYCGAKARRLSLYKVLYPHT